MRLPRIVTIMVSAVLTVPALAIGPSSALAVQGDAASASYAPGSGPNKFVATIKNTGTTNQLYDYVKVPSGNTVTSCSVLTGFPAGTSCIVNGGGPGTAEVAIGSGGLTPSHTGQFSFVTSAPICDSSTCPSLTGAINSTGNQADYVDITFAPPGPCDPITLQGKSTFDDGIVGESYPPSIYSGRTIVGGGTAPYSATVTSGEVPPGLHVDMHSGSSAGTMILSGTPTTPGTYNYTVQVSDSTPPPTGPCTATKSFTVTIHCGGIIITGDDLFGHGEIDKAIKGTPLTAHGGEIPYTWEVLPPLEPGGQPNLPAGTHLSTSAPTESVTLQGTPTREGSYRVRVRVTDANGCVAEMDVRVYVAPRVKAELEGGGASIFFNIQIVDRSQSNSPQPIAPDVRGSSAAAGAAAAKTLVSNDLRYRKRKIGGHYGDYVTAFSDKRVTSYKVNARKGFQYCFSAEPHAAHGKGWGQPVCKKVRG